MVVIMPKVSAFDEYFISENIGSELLQSKILRENIQRAQIWNKLKSLHHDLKSVKLIYQASKDGYDATKLTNNAKDYPFTLSVIQSNHGKTFGSYTPVQWLIGNDVWQKMKKGHRSFAYFFDNQKLRICLPR